MADPIRIDVEIETVDNTDPELSKVTKNLNNMKEAADKANSSTKKAGETVSKFDKSAQKTQKSLASWAKEKYEILLEAKDKISPVLSTVKSGIKGFAGKTWSVTMKAVDLITSPVRGIINLLKNPIFQAGAVLGVTFGVTDTINTYKDFEAAMSEVQATSGATSSELTKLTAKAKEMGATTKFTATESAEAFNYMAMAGWNAQQMTDGIEGILNLAAASGEDLATTSDIVTDALTAFGLKASDATHFSDVLAQASSSANTDVGMMGETFKYVASMAGSLSYSIEDVALMTGLMANSGIKSTQAGTSLNAVLTRLATNSSGAADTIAELGVNFYDSAGNARPLATVMGELREVTKGMNQEQKSNLANTVAGMEAQKGLLAILNASQEDYDKLAESIANADGAAERMSEIQLDNLSGDITLFQSAVDGLKISLGERMSNSWLRDMVQWLTKQVPNVEQMFSDAMDFTEETVDRIKKKYDEISNTDEWQNVNLFGKAKILWDDFIIEPFSEWWESKGKAKINVIAGDIGNAIGTGLTVGIGTLLGIDGAETIDEGSTLGASFAKGFSEGFDFDLISEKIWNGLGNLFSNASKLLPGGESADLSFIFSAAMLMKIGTPLLSIGKGAFSIGKGLFGTGSAGGTSLVGSLLGSTGNAMVSGSGILGGLANVGYALNPGNTAGLYFGSTAGTMSGGMAALTGAGAIAGGVAGGATLISAGIDTYKALKSDDKAEKSAYGTSAGLKAGGVAAGAAIGSLILPGVGTLIGAGVGGIAGWLAGNKVKKDYQENVEEMQKEAERVQRIYEATGLSVDKVRFVNEDLNEALKDTNLSAEELANRIQEDIANVAEEVFGDIHLSLTEVKKLAEEITFGNAIDDVSEFAKSVEDVEDSYSSLKSTISTLKKENWKASLDMQFDETERDDYKNAIDNFAESASQYIDDSHYEATMAFKLITGKDGTDSLNDMYIAMKTQIEEISSQLSENVEIALSDGIIDLNEQEEILNLQQQIEDITNKLSVAQEEASLEVLKIKYGNGSLLDVDSFNSMQEQLKTQVESWTENYDSALEISISNLKLQFPDGGEEYEAALKELQDGYYAQLNEMNVRVQSFNLETIARAWNEQLDGILPDLEGSLSEKLSTAMNNALLEKPDVSAWTQEDVMEWFGLDGLYETNYSAFANLYQELVATAEQIPAKAMEELAQTASQIDFIGPYSQAIYDQLSTLDLSKADMEALKISLSDGVATAIEGADMDNVNAALDIVKGNVETLASTKFGAEYNVTMPLTVTFDYSVSNPNLPTSLLPNTSYNITAQKHAAGGYVSGGPQLSWLAEEGYGEFVIPTNPSRRTRALELYEQAGVALGVAAHAEGGYIAGSKSASNRTDYNLFSEAVKNAPIGYNEARVDNIEDSTETNQPVSMTEKQTGRNTIEVNIQMSPEFVIDSSNGQSETDVMAIIRKNMKAMADELGGEIANRLESVFSNMPIVREV